MEYVIEVELVCKSILCLLTCTKALNLRITQFLLKDFSCRFVDYTVLTRGFFFKEGCLIWRYYYAKNFDRNSVENHWLLVIGKPFFVSESLFQNLANLARFALRMFRDNIKVPGDQSYFQNRFWRFRADLKFRQTITNHFNNHLSKTFPISR